MVHLNFMHLRRFFLNACAMFKLFYSVSSHHFAFFVHILIFDGFLLVASDLISLFIRLLYNIAMVLSKCFAFLFYSVSFLLISFLRSSRFFKIFIVHSQK